MGRAVCAGDRFTLGDEEGDELTHLGRSLAEGDAFAVRPGLPISCDLVSRKKVRMLSTVLDWLWHR